MRIALTADLHIGNFKLFGGEVVAGINDRARLIFQVVRQLAELASKEDCRELWVLGDIFDTTRPEPQIVTEAVNVMSVPHITTELMIGNHDQNSPAAGDHALGPLWQAGFNVHEKPTIHAMDEYEALVVPFWPGDARQWLPEMVRELAKAAETRPRMLLTHVGVYDDKIPAYMRTALDAVPVTLLRDIMAEHNIVLCASGNWHTSRVWSCYADGTILAESAKDDHMLVVDGEPPARVRTVQPGGEEGATVRAYSSLGRGERPDPAWEADRSLVQSATLREPGTPGAGTTKDQSSARRGPTSQERTEDDVPERPLLRQNQAGRESPLHDVRKGALRSKKVSTIVQLGTPCPTGFDNPGCEGVGIFWIFDTTTRALTKHALPGPRFYTLPYSNRIAADIKELPGFPIYVRVKSKIADRQIAEQALQGLAVRSDRPYFGEVIPDKVEVDQMVRQAAEAAGSASTFDERVAAYVAELPLDALVDRSELLGRVRKLLGR